MKLALALLVCATSARAEPLPTTERRLPNGTTVVLAPDATVADVVVHVRVPAGSDDGPAAEVIARALDTLDARLDALGGWSNAAVARDHTSYTLDVPSVALPRALQLLADAFAHATLPRTSDVAAELCTRYAPASILVVIAGAGLAGLDATALPVLAVGDRGACRGMARATIAAAAPAPGSARHDGPRDRVSVAFAAPDPLTAARLDLEVAARVLAARLATHGALRIDPPLSITGSGDGDANRRAIDDELRRLRDTPLTPDELARAVAMLELEQVTALEGLAFRAQAIGDAMMHAHSPRYLERWRALLRGVTSASVQATARAWLDPSHASVVDGGAP